MLMTTESHMTNTQASYNGRVLHSWKEIAVYMGRGVRTIQRYEARLGLPVRRPSGAPRSAVLAFSSEIDQWLAKSPTRVDSSKPGNGKKQNPEEHHIFIQSLYDKARLGHQRADAMQKRMEAMQALVAQLAIRMQITMQNRRNLTTLSTSRQFTDTGISDNFQLASPGGGEREGSELMKLLPS